MNYRILINVLAAAAVLLTAGCRRIDPVGETGDLEIHFSTGEMETKAVEDGDSFKSLLVILKSGTTYYWEPVKFTTATASGSVRFLNIRRDVPYDIYAFANIVDIKFDVPGYWKDITDAESLSTDYEKWKCVTDLLVKNNRVLDASGNILLPDPTDPSATTPVQITADGAMLLTGQGTLGVGATSANVTLQRPFARLRLEIRNSTDNRSIALNELRFGAFKPSATYLFGSTENDGRPVIPDGTTYSTFDKTDGLPMTLSKDATSHIHSDVFKAYLYESIDKDYAAAEYKMYRMYAAMVIDPEYRMRFTLNWNDKTVTVEKVSDAETESNPSATKKIKYGNNEMYGLTETSSGIFEGTFNYQSDWGFLIYDYEENAAGVEWGGSDSAFQLGQAYDIRKDELRKNIALRNIVHLGGLDANNKPVGSVLKAIDLGGTNIAEPIKFLRRNQDFNIVLNVYSGSSEGDVSFEVLGWTERENLVTYE